MAKKIAVGIDIGTYQIKVVVAESPDSGKEFPRVLGMGYAESKGLRHGYITSPADTTQSLLQALAQAEKTSGIKIKRAFLSVGGIGLESIISTASIMISRGDSEIDDVDLNKLHETCEKEIPSSFFKKGSCR